METRVKYTGKLSTFFFKEFEQRNIDKSMKANTYVMADYAGIHSKNLKAYYGWEKQDDDGNWCFEAEFGDQKVTIPFPKLGHDDKLDCQGCLIKGIAWVMEKYKITL